MYRTAIRKFADLARCIGAASLFALLVSQLPLFGSARSPGLVYCPLQKEWVRKSEASKGPSRVFLVDICAPLELKAEFSNRIGVRTIAASADTADLFLDFAEKGDQAFVGIPFVPASDNSPASAVSQNTQRAVSGQFHTAVGAAEVAAGCGDIVPLGKCAVYLSYYSRTPYLEAVSDGVTQRGPPGLL